MAAEENGLRIPDVESLARAATSVKFPNGIFGKTAYIVIGTGATVACICWSAKNAWVSTLGIITVAAVIVYCVKRAFDFAMTHPGAAILEGSHFLKHEEMRMSSKYQRDFEAIEMITIHEPEGLEENTVDAQALLPDADDEGRQHDANPS